MAFLDGLFALLIGLLVMPGVLDLIGSALDTFTG